MKPRDLHKSHDFQTLYAIFGFFRTSVHTLVITFPSKDASTFKFFRAYGISFDSRTSISNFHSLISKFRPTSNFKLTSTDYSPQTNKLTENSKPINKSIYVTRHYILKFKYRTKKFESSKKINHVCRVLEPGHSAKEALPSASCGHSAKIDLCRVPRVDTRQRLNAVSHPNGRCTAGARAGHVRGLCRVRARWHSAKSNGCRVPYFADGQLLTKLGHAVCHVFAECTLAGTRQRSC